MYIYTKNEKYQSILNRPQPKTSLPQFLYIKPSNLLIQSSIIHGKLHLLRFRSSQTPEPQIGEGSSPRRRDSPVPPPGQGGRAHARIPHLLRRQLQIPTHRPAILSAGRGRGLGVWESLRYGSDEESELRRHRG